MIYRCVYVEAIYWVLLDVEAIYWVLLDVHMFSFSSLQREVSSQGSLPSRCFATGKRTIIILWSYCTCSLVPRLCKRQKLG